MSLFVKVILGEGLKHCWGWPPAWRLLLAYSLRGRLEKITYWERTFEPLASWKTEGDDLIKFINKTVNESVSIAVLDVVLDLSSKECYGKFRTVRSLYPVAYNSSMVLYCFLSNVQTLYFDVQSSSKFGSKFLSDATPSSCNSINHLVLHPRET